MNSRRLRDDLPERLERECQSFCGILQEIVSTFLLHVCKGNVVFADLGNVCTGSECVENRFDYRKTLVLQSLIHDF
ncbi:hypothetical protein HMPREF1573_00132 [Gardnerella vaginalis JCP7276]|nr:hypothetical protein HMPREF1573_00132 [Gardnerella vaginalis JCP7276]